MLLLEEYLGQPIEPLELPHKSMLDRPIEPPPMATIQIDGGKKQKVRAGDILGALTGKKGVAIHGKDVGKITIADHWSYVAVRKSVAKHALDKISKGKLKGRSFRAWLVRG